MIRRTVAKTALEAPYVAGPVSIWFIMCRVLAALVAAVVILIACIGLFCIKTAVELWQFHTQHKGPNAAR